MKPNKKSNEATKNEKNELLRRNGLFIKFMELSEAERRSVLGKICGEVGLGRE